MARGKTLVVLLLLAAGLGGFFYYDTYWLNPKREKAETAKGRIWIVEPKDVEGVTIARKGETVRLKRTADGWEMLQPLRVRADRAAVDDMVTGLATARMDREIDPNPAKPADFGLAPPEAEVRLDVKGTPAPLVLRVGSKNPTGVWVYAREGDKPAVMTMSESVARDTARPVADFRDRGVMALDRRNLTGLDLDVAGDQMSLVADEPGKWRIVKPRPLRADAEMVADFLEKLEEDGHHLHVTIQMTFGQEGLTTWMTPDGPVDGTIDAMAWGLGLTLAKFTIDGKVTAQLVNTTPIDHRSSEGFTTIACTGSAGARGTT